MFSVEFVSTEIVLGSLIGVCVFVIFFYYVYLKIRPMFPVRVNCWFCNQFSIVPYLNSNCWDCVNCDQYNGFSVDGGYNKVIPAQHNELLNHSCGACAHVGGESQGPATPGKGEPLPTAEPRPLRLCRHCSLNQELKVQQLAAFSPSASDRYDAEVEQYREHLERAYALCGDCERALHKCLRRQLHWLSELYGEALVASSRLGAQVRASASVAAASVAAAAQCSVVLSAVARGACVALSVALGVCRAWPVLPPLGVAEGPVWAWVMGAVQQGEVWAWAAGAALAVLPLALQGTSSVASRGGRVVDAVCAAVWAAAAGYASLLSAAPPPAFSSSSSSPEDVDVLIAGCVVSAVVLVASVSAAMWPRSRSWPLRLPPHLPPRRPRPQQRSPVPSVASSFAPSPPSPSSLSSPSSPSSPSWPSSSSSRTPSRSRSPAPSYLSTGSGVEEPLEALLGRLRLGSPPPPSASRVRPPPVSPPPGSTSPPATTSPPVTTSPWLQPARLGVPPSWLSWSARRRCVTQTSWVAAGGYGGALGDSSPSSHSVHSGEGLVGSWAPSGQMAAEAASPSRCSSRSSSGFCSLSSAPPHGATSQQWEQGCPLVQVLLRAHAQVHPSDCASAALTPLTSLTPLLPLSPFSPATCSAPSTPQAVTPQSGAECCCVRGSCARSSRSSRGSCSSQTSRGGEADSHPPGQGPAVQQPLWKLEGLRPFLVVLGCSSVLANVALASYIYTR